MHPSSQLRMGWFVEQFASNQDKHFPPHRRMLVLDVGSYDVNGSYRQHFDPDRFDYVGLDMVPGPNVDIVPAAPYAWTEIADDAYDIVISGQALEHVEFPWLTIEEMTRVLKKDGLLCIIVPRGFEEHRYPVDCYRFLTDGVVALARCVGLSILHAHTDCGPTNAHADWSHPGAADTMLVARKPYDGKPRRVDASNYHCIPSDHATLRGDLVPLR
jgi:SAM-dependent methyltransferase